MRIYVAQFTIVMRDHMSCAAWLCLACHSLNTGHWPHDKTLCAIRWINLLQETLGGHRPERKEMKDKETSPTVR